MRVSLSIHYQVMCNYYALPYHVAVYYALTYKYTSKNRHYLERRTPSGHGPYLDVYMSFKV